MTVADQDYERIGLCTKITKLLFLNPLINYLVPRKMLRDFLYNCGSPMARASIDDPGGWRSMVIAYENPEPVNKVDKAIMRLGSFPMGLRNRKRMAVSMLKELLDENAHLDNLVAIGAGAAHNVLEAIASSDHDSIRAFCIDLNADAFGHGREMADKLGLIDRVDYIHGNAVDVHDLISVPPQLVTCIGIIEYLTDEQVVDIFKAMHGASGDHAFLLANSIANTHGTDRFLRTIFKLNLHYRTPEHVTELMEKGGYRVKNRCSEPMKIYNIMVARKE